MGRIAGTTAVETRARIISAALELFSERGYAGTTLRDISERVSLTKSSMYHHFASKDDLLEAIVAPLSESIGALVLDTVERRAELDLADEAGSQALKASVVTQLLDILLDKIGLIRSLMTDPSVIRVLQRDATLGLFSEQFEVAFSGSKDEAVRMQHRCAIGAISGCLIATANGRVDVDPIRGQQDLADVVRPHFPIILRSAMAVLDAHV